MIEGFQFAGIDRNRDKGTAGSRVDAGTLVVNERWRALSARA